MSNLPKIGDTVKTGTLEEIKAIEGVGLDKNGYVVCNQDGTGGIYAGELEVLGETLIVKAGSDWDYLNLESHSGKGISYPTWIYQALLKPTKATKQPKKSPKQSPLETERDKLEARLALVKEGVRLELEIKTDASDLKAKCARLLEIKGGK